MGECFTAVLSQGAEVRAGEPKKEGRKASLRMQYWFSRHYGQKVAWYCKVIREAIWYVSQSFYLRGKGAACMYLFPYLIGQMFISQGVSSTTFAGCTCPSTPILVSRDQLDGYSIRTPGEALSNCTCLRLINVLELPGAWGWEDLMWCIGDIQQDPFLATQICSCPLFHPSPLLWHGPSFFFFVRIRLSSLLPWKRTCTSQICHRVFQGGEKVQFLQRLNIRRWMQNKLTNHKNPKPNISWSSLTLLV